jgi:hypothetical protein
MEIPDSFLSTSSGGSEEVSVRALPFIKHCTRVQMDPRTTEDWELLEVYAQAFEQGDLLQQVSVVYHNQRISLQLPSNAKTVAQVVVREISTRTEAETLWPSLKDETEAGATFALLVKDTEVVITPKPRPRKRDPEWSTPLRLIPCDEDWTEDMHELAERLGGSSSIVVPPGCILVNESSVNWVDKTSRWARISQASNHSKSRLIRVVASSQVPFLQAGM